MKINRLIVAISVLILIFGGVYLSQKLGFWQTKNSGGGRGGDHETESLEHEDLEGTENSEYITEEDHESSELVTGSTTVKDLLDKGISSEQIINIVGEYENEDQLIKDVATQNGLSFGKVKTSLNELMK